MSCSDDQKRCTGHCCEAFSCPSPQYLAANVANIIDGNVLVDMLIPLGPSASSDLAYEEYDTRNRWRYDCRYFSKETRQCTDYAGRPGMCRDYPYGNNCEIDGCTLVSAAGLARRA